MNLNKLYDVAVFFDEDNTVAAIKDWEIALNVLKLDYIIITNRDVSSANIYNMSGTIGDMISWCDKNIKTLNFIIGHNTPDKNEIIHFYQFIKQQKPDVVCGNSGDSQLSRALNGIYNFDIGVFPLSKIKYFSKKFINFYFRNNKSKNFEVKSMVFLSNNNDKFEIRDFNIKSEEIGSSKVKKFINRNKLKIITAAVICIAALIMLTLTNDMKYRIACFAIVGLFACYAAISKVIKRR